MTIARKSEKISNYKFICEIFCIAEDSCKWRVLPKKYWKWYIIYIKLNRWSKTAQLPKALLSSFKTFILEAIKKQKLFNKGNFVVFIDSTSIKVSQVRAKIKIIKNKSIGR